MNDGLLGYIAGLIDGEGTIFIGRQKRKENRSGYRFIPHLIITNTNKACLELCKNTFNCGSLFLRREASFNTEGSIQSRKDCWRWEVKHQQAGEILRQVLPFMVIKKEQAQNLLNFLGCMETQGNYSKYDIDKQFEYYLKSRELNGTKLTVEEQEELRPSFRPLVSNYPKTCSTEGCQSPHYGKGLCRTHWKRQYYKEKLAA